MPEEIIRASMVRWVIKTSPATWMNLVEGGLRKIMRGLLRNSMNTAV